MDNSIRSLRWFGIPLLVLMGTVGCAPSGGGDLVSPTAPSLVPDASASLSQSSALGTKPGPGVPYDATGWWHFVVTDPKTGQVVEEDDAFLTQDANGNISFMDDDDLLITFTRLSTGLINTYRLSASGDASPCDFELSGSVQLDTRTNKAKVLAFVRDTDCSRFVYVVIFTRKTFED